MRVGSSPCFRVGWGHVVLRPEDIKQSTTKEQFHHSGFRNFKAGEWVVEGILRAIKLLKVLRALHDVALCRPKPPVGFHRCTRSAGEGKGEG